MNSPPRRGGREARARQGLKSGCAQAKRGANEMVRSAERFRRTDHPGAPAFLEASPCRARASRRLSRHPSSARRGILPSNQQLYHKRVHILAAIGSIALILIVLWDAFEVIILPRRVRRKFRLTRFFYCST